MIKNVASGFGISVTGTSTFSMPYIASTRPSAVGNIGMMRYHMNCVEVYDGMNWLPFPNLVPSVALDGVTQEAIEWVRKKMQQEKELAALAKLHPTVADAVQAKNHAEDAVKIAVALCRVSA